MAISTGAATALQLTTELSAVLGNRLPDIPELAAVIEPFLEARRVPEDIVFRINMAVDELLTNAITYGYRDDARHLIRVNVAVADEVIDVNIEDDAVAFDPFERDEVDVSRDIEERQIGGLGIHLVKEMLQYANYRRVGDRNRIALRQSFVAVAEPQLQKGAVMSDLQRSVLLAPSGRLDANTSADFEKEVMQQLSLAPSGMVMDFSGLRYVSSAGLRVVLLAAKKLKAAGGTFVLCGLSSSIEEVFKISGFLSILTVEPDRDAAMTHFA
ncbi:MAG TPA: anti-sigma factor antagonist [Stellaceae bacterium]|nr:anti-sigma factor antagonist [Stellaceae bacterium]